MKAADVFSDGMTDDGTRRSTRQLSPEDKQIHEPSPLWVGDHE